MNNEARSMKYEVRIGSIATVMYVLGVVLLFLYSFTQIDLNLTLSSSHILYEIQRVFQRIGYFQRPLSTILYVSVMALLLTTYWILFIVSQKKKITEKTAWLLVGISAGVLLFSYPGFSYDIFNYLFDARIVTLYQENPYVHKALDYLQDPWINIMRWTHRTYPYGPGWLVLTVPLSVAGFQKFVVTLYLFKALMVGCYLASVLAIKHIMEKINPGYVVPAILLFALNPLIITESLVSAHNDIVMMALSLWSFYFLVSKRKAWSLVFLLFSISIKFATVFLIPAYVYVFWLMQSKKKVLWEYVILTTIAGMTLAVAAATIRTQFQPWYLLYVLPFAALLPQRVSIVIPVVIISIAGMLQYVPFLYTGKWDPPIPTILNVIMASGVIISLLVVAVRWRS
ncbi:hypothetical protein HY469_04665 [Candidatus Roizmanbacteria bacterium]|nr:hypothetical protein [Candidatus Roizmanbacteria bacterium]